MSRTPMPLPQAAARITLPSPTALRLAALCAALAGTALLGACTVVEPAPVVYSPPPRAQPMAPPAVVTEPPPVVSVYAEPPLVQPPPLLVPWAPPPMLVQAPPPAPFADAFWVGGNWVWQGRWVWSAGYWARPPRPGYFWVEPYYEHRGSAVVFVSGFWSAPGVVFVPPPPTLSLSLSVALPGVVGSIAIGPQGVFVPAPPGSALGLIVPAPIGTPPAVVTGAPAIIHGGMHIVNNRNVTINNTVVNNTVINNNITNVRNVIVQAPASATANHQAFESNVPAHAALAAAAAPMTHWQAPLPQTQQRFNLAAMPGRAAAPLPPPQAVRVQSTPLSAAPQSPLYRAPHEPAALERHEQQAAPPRALERGAQPGAPMMERPPQERAQRMPAPLERAPEARMERPTPAVQAPPPGPGLRDNLERRENRPPELRPTPERALAAPPAMPRPEVRNNEVERRLERPQSLPRPELAPPRPPERIARPAPEMRPPPPHARPEEHPAPKRPAKREQERRE